jgi:hypothetical protein
MQTWEYYLKDTDHLLHIATLHNMPQKWATSCNLTAQQVQTRVTLWDYGSNNNEHVMILTVGY